MLLTGENPAAAAAATANGTVLLSVVVCAPVKGDDAAARVTPRARLTRDEKLVAVFDESLQETIRSLFSSLSVSGTAARFTSDGRSSIYVCFFRCIVLSTLLCVYST